MFKKVNFMKLCAVMLSWLLIILSYMANEIGETYWKILVIQIGAVYIALKVCEVEP